MCTAGALLLTVAKNFTARIGLPPADPDDDYSKRALGLGKLNNVNNVTCSPDGDLYCVRGGDLYVGPISPPSNATDWFSQARRVGKNDWGRLKFIFFHPNGDLYVVTNDGLLYKGPKPEDENILWLRKQATKIGSCRWQCFEALFFNPDGILYAVDRSGKLVKAPPPTGPEVNWLGEITTCEAGGWLPLTHFISFSPDGKLWCVNKTTGTIYRGSPPVPNQLKKYLDTAEKLGKDYNVYKFLCLTQDKTIQRITPELDGKISDTPVITEKTVEGGLLLTVAKDFTARIGLLPADPEDNYSKRALGLGKVSNVTNVTCSPDGDLYCVRGGDLYVGPISPSSNATDWFSQARRVGKNDWGRFKFIFFHPNGDLYVATNDGLLYKGPKPENENISWLYKQATKIGNCLWQCFEALFFSPDGILYAVDSSGGLVKAPPPTGPEVNWLGEITICDTEEWLPLTHFISFSPDGKLWCVDKNTGTIYRGSPPDPKQQKYLETAEKLGKDYNIYKFICLTQDKTALRIMPELDKKFSDIPVVTEEIVEGGLLLTVAKDFTARIGLPPADPGDDYSKRALDLGKVSNVTSVTCSPDGDLYCVRNGDLYVGPISPSSNATDWFSQARRVGKNDWDRFKFIFFHPNGDLYVATNDGLLYKGPKPENENISWLYTQATKIGNCLWQYFEVLFFSPDGILYAVDSSGELVKAPPPTGPEVNWMGEITTCEAGGWLPLTHFISFSPDGKLWCVDKNTGTIYRGSPPDPKQHRYLETADRLGKDYNVYKFLCLIQTKTIQRITPELDKKLSDIPVATEEIIEGALLLTIAEDFTARIGLPPADPGDDYRKRALDLGKLSNVTNVTCSPDGDLYCVRGGDLYVGPISPSSNATDWFSQARRVGKNDWGIFKFIFFHPNGDLYVVTNDGLLYKGPKPEDENISWLYKQATKIGNCLWQYFEALFFSPDGILYAVDSSGGLVKAPPPKGPEVNWLGEITTCDAGEWLPLTHFISFSPDGKLWCVDKNTGTIYRGAPPDPKQQRYLETADKLGKDYNVYKFLCLTQDKTALRIMPELDKKFSDTPVVTEEIIEGGLLLTVAKDFTARIGLPPADPGDDYSKRALDLGKVNNVTNVTCSPDGDLYCVRNGDLYVGPISPSSNATDWFSQARRVGINDWGRFKFIFFHPNGDLYVATNDGLLYKGPKPENENISWLYKQAKKIGNSLWQYFEALFFSPDGILYAVNSSGGLVKAPPPKGPEVNWMGEITTCDAGGWLPLTHFISFSPDGKLWCVDKNTGTSYRGAPPDPKQQKYLDTAEKLGKDYNVYKFLCLTQDRIIQRILSFEFLPEEGKKISEAPMVIEEVIYDNRKSALKLKYTFSFSKTIRQFSSFTHSHNFTFPTGTERSVTAGIPFIATNGTKITMNTSSSHTWTLNKPNETEVTFSASTHAEIPPGKAIHMVASVLKADLTVPYRARVLTVFGQEVIIEGTWNGQSHFNMMVKQKNYDN